MTLAPSKQKKRSQRNVLKCFVKSLSCVQLFATSRTVAYQAPPSMGFSKQEYWSGLPFPSPGDLPDPGIEPRLLTLQAGTLWCELPGNCFKILCQFLLYSKVNQLYMYIYSLFWDFLPIQGTRECRIEFPQLYRRFSLVICLKLQF